MAPRRSLLNPFRLNMPGLGWAEADMRESALVHLGDRKVPRVIRTHFVSADGQPALDMVLEVVDGLPQCREVNISAVEGGREVKPLDLKAVKLNEWTEAMFSRLAVTHDRGVIALEFSRPAYNKGGAAFRAARKGKGARKIDEDFLTRVAKIYAEHPDRPTKAVRDAFGVSDSMASVYVRRARQADLLNPRP